MKHLVRLLRYGGPGRRPLGPRGRAGLLALLLSVALTVLMIRCSGPGSEGATDSSATWTDTQSDIANCGALGNACRLSHAIAVCSGGRCEVVACDDRWGNCDGDPANGCETDLDASAECCGSCDRVCQLPNASAACSNGTCRIASCDGGWADCNDSEGDGCETSIRTDPAHCGACGEAVPPGQYCVDGAPSLHCPPPLIVCHQACVDARSDAANCGACGNACQLDHATAICSGGACQVGACEPHWGDCDGEAANGCEMDLDWSVQHCGACANVCRLDHANTACSRGTCRVASCERGWGDCNDRDPDGCETDLNASVGHCGACERPCQFLNASAACSNGTCRIASCVGGWGDCNGSEADGCETNTRTDPAHCGACREAVPSGQYCVHGAPSLTCPPPLIVCGQACIDARTDAANCGFCGNVCRLTHATAACSGGTCHVASCERFWGDCDRDARNGCDTWLAADPNCGVCGDSCPAGYRCVLSAGSSSAGCAYWP